MMVVDGAMSGVARWDSSLCLNSVFVDVLSINSSCSPCSHGPSLWTESPSETTHQYSGVPTANDILTADNQIPRATIESERKKQILHIYIHLSNPPTGHRHLWMCVCLCACVFVCAEQEPSDIMTLPNPHNNIEILSRNFIDLLTELVTHERSRYRHVVHAGM